VIEGGTERERERGKETDRIKKKPPYSSLQCRMSVQFETPKPVCLFRKLRVAREGERRDGAKEKREREREREEKSREKGL